MAKEKAFSELSVTLGSKEGEKNLYQYTRRKDQVSKDVQQVRVGGWVG